MYEDGYLDRRKDCELQEGGAGVLIPLPNSGPA